MIDLKNKLNNPHFDNEMEEYRHLAMLHHNGAVEERIAPAACTKCGADMTVRQLRRMQPGTAFRFYPDRETVLRADGHQVHADNSVTCAGCAKS